MTENPVIKRKDFLTRCGSAFLGLGLGAACGKSPEEKSQGQETSKADPPEAYAAQSGPVIPAYRTLGKAKIKVTEIGFGASRTMDPTLMNYAFESGINFFDTGRSYYNGQNEVLIGKVFKGKRDKLVINSKIQPGSLEKMRRDLEASLKALDTDYIDCLMIHGADEPEHVSSDEIKEFLSKAREQGKARSYGFSSHGDMVKLLEIAATEQFHEVIMVPYNFMGRYTHMLGGSKKEWDAQALAKAIDKCGAAGIDFVSMKGCSGGFLKDSTGPQTYRAALKWILENPYLKTTATAMGNFQEIDEDIRAMGSGKLGAAEKELLDRYAALYGAWYCRMCGSCDGQCPNGVRVAEVNRLHMYVASYGGDMAREARASYPRLGKKSASACKLCENCSVECPYGLQIGKKMVAAHRVLS